ncbi:unnamed protein product [Ectocarpus sp. 13 AM-2016]
MPPSMLKKRAEALMRLGRIFTAAAKGKNPDPGTFYSVENAPDPFASSGAAGSSQPAYGGGYGGGDTGFDISNGHTCGNGGFTAREEGWREGGGSAGGGGGDERPPQPPPPPASGSRDYEGEVRVESGEGEAGVDGRLYSGSGGGGDGGASSGVEKTFCAYDADEDSTGGGMGRSFGRRDDDCIGHEALGGGGFRAKESGEVEGKEILEPFAEKRSWPPPPPDFPCRAHDDCGATSGSLVPDGCDDASVGGITGISGISGGSSLSDSHQGVPRNMDGRARVRGDIGQGQERETMSCPDVLPERNFFGRQGAAEDDWRDSGAATP